MANSKKNAAKTAAETAAETVTNVTLTPDENGVFAAETVYTEKSKATIKLNPKGGLLVILPKEFNNDLLLKGTEVLQIGGSHARKLLRETKISSAGLKAAAAKGQVMVEIIIQKTIAGQPYYYNGSEGDDAQTFIAGANANVEDGTELHRATVGKFIVSKQGRVIAEQQDEIEGRLAQMERRNPTAYLNALLGIGGPTGGTARVAKETVADDADFGADDDLSNEKA